VADESTEKLMVAFYQNLKQLLLIHGHGGKTKVVWHDEEAGE